MTEEELQKKLSDMPIQNQLRFAIAAAMAVRGVFEACSDEKARVQFHGIVALISSDQMRPDALEAANRMLYGLQESRTEDLRAASYYAVQCMQVFSYAFDVLLDNLRSKRLIKVSQSALSLAANLDANARLARIPIPGLALKTKELMRQEEAYKELLFKSPENPMPGLLAKSETRSAELRELTPKICAIRKWK